MEEKPYFDSTHLSFDEVVSFLFDHEVPVQAGRYKPWYFSIDVTFDAGRVCEYYVRLFRQPGLLLGRFSKAELEEGSWAIHGVALQCSVSHVIWDTDLPFAVRQECVRSMIDLFKEFFANERLDSSVQMWWDSLCYEWHCGNRDRQRGGEDLLMQDVMFSALADILALDSEICQDAALHGLGHLHHPETEELIQAFITQHPSLTKKRKDYALAASRYEVQ